MASKGSGVIVVISGEDQTGQVFAAVKAHMEETKTASAGMSSSIQHDMRDMQESITLMRDAFVLDRVYETIKGAIERTVDLGMELGHLSQQTGISTQALSVLRYTAAQTGIDFETFTKGFKKMSTDIFEWTHGEKLAGEAFLDLGISLKDVQAKGQNMYGVLSMVANKFQAMPDGPHKLAIAVELFGRAGQQLIPVLNQGAAGLTRYHDEAEKLGMILDEDTIQKMEELHASMVKAQTAVEGDSMAFGEGLAPALEAVANLFSDATSGANRWQSAGKGVGIVALGIAGAMYQIFEAVRQLVDEWKLFDLAARDMTTIPIIPTPWNKDLIAAQKQVHAAREQEARDIQADHDAAYKEEVNFNSKMIGLQKPLEAPDTSSPTDRLMSYLHNSEAFHMLSGGGGGTSGGAKGRAGSADALASLQKRVADSLRALADAAAKLDETKLRAHAQTVLAINQEMYRQGLVSEADYLKTKQQYETAGYDAEASELKERQTGLQSQIAALSAKTPKTDKDRLTAETQINELKARELGIEGQLAELAEKRAKSAWDMQQAEAAWAAKPIDASGLGGSGMPDLSGLFPKAALPSVVLAKDYSAVEGEAEKLAHGVFDPLFHMGEKWSQQMKQIRANILQDLGQMMESQLFGAMFGDPEGRGGKGWNGGSFHGDTSKPGGGRTGLASEALGGLMGLFHRKSGPVSNGTGNAGAGTVLSSVAGALQVGKGGGSGSGGVQVILNNMGTPQQVDSTQQSGGQAEAMILQVVLKDQQTNGAITQGFSSLFSH